MRCFTKVLTVSWCLFFASLLGAPTANAAAGGRAASAQPGAADRYGDLPLSFEANLGQTDGQVRFVSRGSGYSFFLTQAGAVLSFSKDAHSDSVLRMQLAGASPNARIQGLDELPGKSNYFAGSDSTRWRTDVPTYSRVKYENVYPGISLVYYGNQRQLEYDFVVAPGADPQQIRLSIAGAQKLTVDSAGNLVLHNAAGEVQLLAPKVYQVVQGQKKEIPGQWTLAANSVAGFRIAKYDRTQPLVIDPVLLYSSFLGGSQKNALSKIAIDAAGNAYVAGYTTSGDFPAAPTPLATTLGPGARSRGAFVAKIDPSGSNLLYSTYLSGSADEEATGLAVDKSGNVYVAGNTHSTDFPTRNAFQSTCSAHAGTCATAFLTKISPTGDSLLFSTYLGGSGGESARGLVVDATGSAYLAGVTSSVDFPVTSGAAQAKCAGTCQQNAFVAKFSPSGAKLVYATYVGGSAVDDASDLAVDATGSVYLAGRTTSADFPLATPYQKSCAADAASTSKACVATAFVTKIKADGTAFVYSTYIGGSLGSQASAIAVDSQGSAYVTGSTQSPDFPVAKAFQKSCGLDATSGKCSIDAFLTKFAPTGKTLVYSTYLGGAGRDEASGIAVDAAGTAHIVGRTESADFPTASPMQSELKGTSDAFVARFSATGSSLAFSTYHGGSAAESGNGIALDSKGGIYITGETSSTDFPTRRPFQSSCAGACASAFVAKMSLPPVGVPASIAPVSGTTPQSAVVNAAFATNLAAVVLDSGSNPVVGVVVTFTRPASGASGIFTDSTNNITTATTDATGTATAAVFTANSFAGGPYNITATINALSTNFALTNTAGTVNKVTAVAGTTPQSAVVNNAFANNLAVTVLDAANKPLGGLTVTFTGPASGASGVFSDSTTNTTTATTDAAGVATAAVFTANSFAGGPYNVTGATGGKNATFALTNTAGTVNKVTPVAGTTPQSAVVNNAFTNDLAVTVLDAANKPLGGLTVTFTAPSSGASGVFTDSGTETTTAVTDKNGLATAAVFTANPTAGTYNVTGVTGAKTGTFALTNTAGTVSKVTPVAGTTPQSAVVNAAFTNDLAVTVLDAANKPLGGLTVTFTAPSSGASGVFTDSGTETTTAVTDKNGLATAAVFTANPFAGAYNATATTGGKTGTFALTNTAGTVSKVTAVAGTTPQSAVVNNAFTNAPAVTVLDAANKPLGGLTVTFTAPNTVVAASGNFADSGTNATIAITDKNGLATAAVFTANPFAGGPYTVTGATGGKTANFALTNTAGTVATVTAVAGTTPQTTAVNAAFNKSLAVTVLDAGSNPLGGLTVTFTAPATLATCAFSGSSTATATTDITGVASAPCTANTTSGGPYTATGATAGKTANFTLTNRPGPPATITPGVGSTPQSTPVTNAFGNIFTGTVTDQFGNTVPAGITVIFTPPSSGASGTFAGGANSTQTDPSGVFSTATFTANGTAGAYNVAAATTTGTATTNYSLTNTDFTLLQTPPTSTIFIQGQNAPISASAPPVVTVTQKFGYTGTVTLNCVNGSLPSGVTCQAFTPPIAAFTNGAPASVLSSLTLNTSASAPVGLYVGSPAQNVVKGVDASPTNVTNNANFVLAVQCALSLQQTLPTFTPSQGTAPNQVPNQFSIGVSVTQGGSACPYGAVQVAGGITPGNASGDGNIVTSTIVSGQNGTLASGGSAGMVTFEMSGTSGSNGSVKVPYFDATQTADIGSISIPVGSETPVPESVVKGGTISPFPLPISLPQAAGNTVTVPNSTLSTATTVCGAVDSTGAADPLNQNFGITCSATASSSSVQLTVSIPAAAAAASRSRDRSAPAMLFALALGFPAIVFLSVGASAFAPRKSKRGLNRLTCILGVLLLLSLLVVLPACGGGFHAILGTSNTNNYTLTVMAYVTDSSNNVVGVDVFTVLLTVN